MKNGSYLFFTLCALILAPCNSKGHTVYSADIKSLQVTVNGDWLSMPVMTLGGNDELMVDFDCLTHIYHRFTYRIVHCESDWRESDDLFESDWLVGFNNVEIDDCEESLNTNELYTHYSMKLPNDHSRLKMSGNYRLLVFSDDDDSGPVLEARFYIVEHVMSVTMRMTTNTDRGVNSRWQQLNMSLSYGETDVTFPERQIQTVVMQNGGNRWADTRVNMKANFITDKGMRWEHNNELIFPGGNEYHKHEVLALDHATMGIDYMSWDGSRYHAWPFVCEPRYNYSYDEDANGAFLIRNSDNDEPSRLCDYVWTHYRLVTGGKIDQPVYICADWTVYADSLRYRMNYDSENNLYTLTLLQKQGYYSYRYITLDDNGAPCPLTSEGNFYETENEYQAFVYYKGPTERTWRLVAYQHIGGNTNTH